MFTKACCKGRLQANNIKTLASFQAFFSLANKDRQLNMTTGKAGYLHQYQQQLLYVVDVIY